MLVYGTNVTSCYVVASTQRTGSWFLCDSLAAARVVGRPVEPFAPEFRKDYCDIWGIAHDVGDRQFVETLVKASTGRNGVFGFKVHWNQIRHMRELLRLHPSSSPREVLHSLFPCMKYIYVTRRDTRLQAISMYRACKSNRWWVVEGVENHQVRGPDPDYSSLEIRKMEARALQMKGEWEAYFRRHDVNPLRVEYEDLSRDYRREVARCLLYLGADPQLANHLPPPRYVRQADSKTERWKARLDNEDTRLGTA
jgi:trehalose 2-sulfotransferase